MSRPILAADKIHPAIRDKVAQHEDAILREVQDAIAAHAVVIVGMKQNPFPRQARKLLESEGIAHHYLEYGSYIGDWRRRTALKMWSGWPTFPMVFVTGMLVGGAQDLRKLADSGELKKLLAGKSWASR